MEDMGDDPSREAARPARTRRSARRTRPSRPRPSDQYATRHNPFVYFHSIIDDAGALRRRDVVPLEPARRRPGAASRPRRTLAFITPDLCHDGHDAPCADGGPGGLPAADAFLRTWVPRIIASPAYRHDGAARRSPSTRPASDSTRLLRRAERAEHAGRGGHPAARAAAAVGAVILSPAIAPGQRRHAAVQPLRLLRGDRGPVRRSPTSATRRRAPGAVALSRRAFLGAAGAGVGALAIGRLPGGAAAAKPAVRPHRRRDDGEPVVRPLPRLAARRRRQAGRPDASPTATGVAAPHASTCTDVPGLRLHRPRPLLRGRPGRVQRRRVRRLAARRATNDALRDRLLPAGRPPFLGQAAPTGRRATATSPRSWPRPTRTASTSTPRRPTGCTTRRRSRTLPTIWDRLAAAGLHRPLLLLRRPVPRAVGHEVPADQPTRSRRSSPTARPGTLPDVVLRRPALRGRGLGHVGRRPPARRHPRRRGVPEPGLHGGHHEPELGATRCWSSTTTSGAASSTTCRRRPRRSRRRRGAGNATACAASACPAWSSRRGPGARHVAHDVYDHTSILQADRVALGPRAADRARRARANNLTAELDRHRRPRARRPTPCRPARSAPPARRARRARRSGRRCASSRRPRAGPWRDRRLRRGRARRSRGARAPRGRCRSSRTRPFSITTPCELSSSPARAFCSTSRIVRPSAFSRRDRLEDQRARARVEAHRRLVEHDQRGIEHQAARELDQALLAAGEAAGLLAGPLAHDREQLLRPRRAGGARAPGRASVKAPISTFSRTVMSREQAVRLRHLRDARARGSAAASGRRAARRGSGSRPRAGAAGR